MVKRKRQTELPPVVLATGDSFTAVRTVNNYYVMSTCYLRPVFVREILSSFINIASMSYFFLIMGVNVRCVIPILETPFTFFSYNGSLR